MEDVVARKQPIEMSAEASDDDRLPGGDG